MTKYVVTDPTEHELGMKICESIGLEPTMVRRIVLDLQVGEAAKVFVEAFVDDDVVGKIEIDRIALKVADGAT